MKKLTLLSALTLSLPSLLAQDVKPLADAKNSDEVILAPIVETKTDESKVNEAYKQAINDFSNLPEAQRQKFLKKRQEAGILFQNKRVIEALEAIRELNAIFDRDPQIMNLCGACFVELRDFSKASAEFQKSMAITGPNVNVLFNIGEVAFVSEDWQNSLKFFTQALELAPEKAVEMRSIIELKLMLSHISLAKDTSLSEDERSAHDAKVIEYSKLRSFLDDSPYYYYATAALYFSKGDDDNGRKTLAKAHRIYASTPQALASWEDTFTEYGYLTSYYGDKAAEE